jgi:hypothetical protein
MRRRAELVPYTYTLARAAFDTGLAPLRPLYYEYPEIDQAYAADASGNFAQYFFGPDLVGKSYYSYTAVATAAAVAAAAAAAPPISDLRPPNLPLPPGTS